MFGQLFSADIQITFIVILILILLLYVLSIVWVIRDAYSRGAKYKFWGLIALIPFVGVIIYILLRPQLLIIDRDEQELEIAIKQRELLKYGECSRCGYPVMNDYVVCPNCQQQLKTKCRSCGKALDFKWKACPWCGAIKIDNAAQYNANAGVATGTSAGASNASRGVAHGSSNYSVVNDSFAPIDNSKLATKNNSNKNNDNGNKQHGHTSHNHSNNNNQKNNQTNN